MKNFSKFAMAMAVMLCAGFAACGGDDDNGDSGSGTIETQPLVDKDGKQVRLTSAGDVKFNYDEKGRLVSFGIDEEEMFFINGSTITSPGSSIEYRLSTNSRGFITKMVISYDEKHENGGWDKGSGDISISYNESGEITSATGTGNSEYKEVHEGQFETGGENSTINQSFVWSNGNLTKVVGESKGTITNGGEQSNYTEAKTYTFNYGNQANAIRQYPYYVGDVIIGEGVGFLAMAGLFGVGPAYLPTGYTTEHVENYANEQPYSGSRSYLLTYSLNTNGTIATEKRDNGETIQYGYSNETRAAMLANEVEAQLPVLKKMLFNRHRR